MLQRLSNKNALTLTELLVSSFLMGIVMVGIAGFSVSIKRMQDTTDKQAILAMLTASAMAAMERNISLINGSYAYNGGSQPPAGTDPAYLFDNSNPRTYWAFRSDRDTNGNPNDTPDDSSDDSWTIFFSQNNGADRWDLNMCIQPYGMGGAPNISGGNPCSPGNRVVILNEKLESLNIQWVENNSPSALDLYIEVSLQTLFDASSSWDATDNPRYTMTTRIPLQSYAHNPIN